MSTVYDLSFDQLSERLAAGGEPAFRARQVWTQLWKRAATYEEMSDVSPAIRERLTAALPLGVDVLDERTADRGATRKALLKLGGTHVIEAVLMGYRDRVTVCVSSQAGCAMGCTFCATGQMGLRNNLTAGEIAAQVVWARREARRLPATTPQRLGNVVFMGMGEPIGGCLLPRSTNTSSGPLTMTSVIRAKDPSRLLAWTADTCPGIAPACLPERSPSVTTHKRSGTRARSVWLAPHRVRRPSPFRGFGFGSTIGVGR
jgi:hypothetical protein